MKNSKIKLFEVMQVKKMREKKIENKIHFTQDKFYVGDFVNISLKLKNAKGEDFIKQYISGIVVKSNTKRTQSTQFLKTIDENNLQECQHLNAHDYITIGSILNPTNRLCMKVRVNQPNIIITLVRSAKRKTGALVAGHGRTNVQAQFMDSDISASRLKKMFKNTIN